MALLRGRVGAYRPFWAGCGPGSALTPRRMGEDCDELFRQLYKLVPMDELRREFVEGRHAQEPSAVGSLSCPPPCIFSMENHYGNIQGGA
jgi:hypothetical protein